MMTQAYLLDADSFIRAKRQHYGFGFCPGYWDALLQLHAYERVVSIDPVKEELERGNDDLSDWVKDVAPRDFFASIVNAEIQTAHTSILSDVQSNEQYTQAAKERFAKCADPWLIAYAMASSCIITTYETAAPDSRNSIKIPDIASLFDVTCVQPHEMLSELKVLLQLDNSNMIIC